MSAATIVAGPHGTSHIEGDTMTTVSHRTGRVTVRVFQETSPPDADGTRSGVWLLVDR